MTRTDKVLSRLSPEKKVLLPGYFVQGKLVPEECTLDFADSSQLHYSQVLELTVKTDQGQTVASAEIMHDKENEIAMANALEVKPQYRRKGIASAIYQYAENLLKATMIPSPDQSKDAKKFWKARHK